MKQKGYVMTWDAILALIFIILVLMGLISLEYSETLDVKKRGFLELHSTSEDAIEILNKMGILGSIVAYWSENNTEMANETANFYLEQIITENMGYRLVIGNDIICENPRIREDEASDKTKATRLVTGYGKNKFQEFIARAWLLYDDIAISKNYSIENVSYGKGFGNASGCTWDIEYKDSETTTDTATIPIPDGYSGNNNCNYNSGDYSEPEEDAVNDAIYRLFSKIDQDPDDGVLDEIKGLYFDPAVMKFKTAKVTTRSMTDAVEVTLVLWMR